MKEYFQILLRLRNHYPQMPDHVLFLLMFELEDAWEPHDIREIAKDETKLFHFSPGAIWALYREIQV